MKSAAMEFGEYGIMVNALIPGLIDTALTRHEDRYAQAIETSGKTPSGDGAKDEETARKGLASKSPLGVLWIAPDDVAPMVVFLASDEARMVSGGTFSVTAGDSANIEILNRTELTKSAEWNRGAYLVQGLEHCGACHTPKTFSAATISRMRFRAMRCRDGLRSTSPMTAREGSVSGASPMSRPI